MILEYFLIEKNGNRALIVVIDEKTYETAPAFEMGMTDDFNREFEVILEPGEILDYVDEEYNVYIYSESDEDLKEYRRYKVD
jgi:hypothetical protein